MKNLFFVLSIIFLTPIHLSMANDTPYLSPKKQYAYEVYRVVDEYQTVNKMLQQARKSADKRHKELASTLAHLQRQNKTFRELNCPQSADAYYCRDEDSCSECEIAATNYQQALMILGDKRSRSNRENEHVLKLRERVQHLKNILAS